MRQDYAQVLILVVGIDLDVASNRAYMASAVPVFELGVDDEAVSLVLDVSPILGKRDLREGGEASKKPVLDVES